jgi:hypothetical protein
MSRRTKYDDELVNLSAISDDLRRLGKKLRGRDADAIDAALEALDGFTKITRDLRTLGIKLLAIEDVYERDAAKFPEHLGMVDLFACAMAMKAVKKFLLMRVVSRNLQMLIDGLVEIAMGTPPAAMFHPRDHSKGRRADSLFVMRAKGAVAAEMHVLQSTGMSRQEAAEWIVRHISPNLAARISRKPLTARTVEEWLDRFGGSYAEYNEGRLKYLFISSLRREAISPQRFREITEHMAKDLLARKPK